MTIPDLSSCVAFLQRLIQTPGLPGEEAATAALVQAEMAHLGYDESWSDEAGNVIGLIRGRGLAPAVMLNTHLDHVDVGDHAAWPFPPFGGDEHDGRIWGRGACDIKGPLAAQVYGVAGLLHDDARPQGDVYVTAVVQEETGGLGARHLAEWIDTPLVVVGEPSRNEIRRGHRGRTELVLHVTGYSAHASAPHRGVNPLDVVARFILGMKTLDMREDSDMGPSTVVPTLIRTDQTSGNVIPAEAWLTCDWRNIPGETAEDARRLLQDLAQQCLMEGAVAEVTVPVHPYTSYTGLVLEMPSDMPSFGLAADHAAVLGAKSVLESALSAPVPVGIWDFATDGGNFAQAGMMVVGFGPGEEELAHTVRESIAVADLDVAMRGNAALAREWPARCEKVVNAARP